MLQYDTRRKIRTLIRDCKWQRPVDITSLSFEAWRASHSKSTKTMNDYLAAIRGFLRWMCKRKMIAADALAAVEKVKSNGVQVRPRRAFTDDELRRLLPVADWRAPMYLTAVYTGLRRGELEQLQWGDVQLDVDNPFLTVRASTSKNRTSTTIPLHGDVIKALRALRPAAVEPDTRVFRTYWRTARFKKDLETAGIAYRDAQGRYADFHSFRYTYDTNLARAGAGERVRMELMRHSDPRLTSKIYTAASQLPTNAAVQSLPSIQGGGAQGCAQLAQLPRFTI